MINDNLTRKFIPGSSWLYYKIYTGVKTSDKILNEFISPVVEKLQRDNTIEKWFFLRYSDPHHHLRVRFKCSDKKSIGLVINALYPELEHYSNKYLIWKIQIDTYNRELERYGPNSIELSESIFHYDSNMVIYFLNYIKQMGTEREEIRWLFALRVMDSWLSSFRLKNEDKLDFLFKMSTNFKAEFNLGRQIDKQISTKYRKYRSKIEEFLLSNTSNNKIKTPVNFVIEKEKNIKDILIKVLKMEKSGDLKVNLHYLMASHIHMSLNRIFKSKNRLNEMICYDFLYLYYKSLIAKSKSTIGEEVT